MYRTPLNPWQVGPQPKQDRTPAIAGRVVLVVVELYLSAIARLAIESSSALLMPGSSPIIVPIFNQCRNGAIVSELVKFK